MKRCLLHDNREAIRVRLELAGNPIYLWLCESDVTRYRGYGLGVTEVTDFGPNPESDHERVAIPVESSENRAQRPLATQRGLGRVNSQTA